MKTNNNFHILIVDDEPFNIELAEAYLEEEGYKLSFAKNAETTFQQVSKHKIDLILLDINMPGKDGFEVCKALKEDTSTKDIAIIFLTAQTDVDYISRAFEIGGADYISKPFFGLELKARVKTQLQNVAYLQEIKAKQSKLAQLTITDPSTKIYNSLYFDSQVKMHQNRGESFWIVYIKIDRFEKINQLYGYSTANKIIRQFAALLKSASFSNALVARIYGINFGILLKGYDEKSVKKMYENVFLQISQDKNLAKVITFSTVLYNVKESSLTLPVIYKNIELAMRATTEQRGEKYLVI
jgi:diguanylate cyclase (GGDEF)-like protein